MKRRFTVFCQLTISNHLTLNQYSINLIFFQRFYFVSRQIIDSIYRKTLYFTVFVLVLCWIVIVVVITVAVLVVFLRHLLQLEILIVSIIIMAAIKILWFVIPIHLFYQIQMLIKSKFISDIYVIDGGGE